MYACKISVRSQMLNSRKSQGARLELTQARDADELLSVYTSRNRLHRIGWLCRSNTHLHQPSLSGRCPHKAFLGQNQVWNQKHHEQDEEAEATEKPIAETSVPPTTTTTTITTATTRGPPPAISLVDAARYGDVAALKQHLQARLPPQ